MTPLATTIDLLEAPVVGPDGLLLPGEVIVYYRGPGKPDDLPYDVTLKVRIVHGEVACEEAHVFQREGGPPLTKARLRDLPIDQLARDGLASWASPFNAGVTESEAQARMHVPGVRGQGSDPKYRPALRAKVVKLYEDLSNAEYAPKPLIAAKLHISTSYVSKLLAEARRLGELAPASPSGRKP